MASIKDGYVYFASNGSSIKIGHSKIPTSRLKDLQIGQAISLHILGTIPGTPDDERELHGRFAHLRQRGEWFKSAPELLEFVEVVCKEKKLPYHDIMRVRRDLLEWSKKFPQPWMRCSCNSVGSCLALLADDPDNAEVKDILIRALCDLEENLTVARRASSGMQTGA